MIKIERNIFKVPIILYIKIIDPSDAPSVFKLKIQWNIKVGYHKKWNQSNLFS